MPEEKLIYSKDDIPPFLPQNPRFVILGTMATLNARLIEGRDLPTSSYFYYNDNRNRFWRYIWEIFENKATPPILNIQDKMTFCENHGIALCNLLGGMYIHEKDAKDRKDTIIFKANEEGRVNTKVVNSEFRKALKFLPTFFTCYHKDDLQKLLELFFATNELKINLANDICYLHTPAMPGRIDVLSQWREAFKQFSGC